MQEHTARAFWHLAVADSDAVFEAVTERSGLVALLKLAAPEVTRGAQLARQALRRLCEDSEVSPRPRILIQTSSSVCPHTCRDLGLTLTLESLRQRKVLPEIRKTVTAQDAVPIACKSPVL